ncbi:hypothetical protein C8Q75DRAFT_895566 [Abortiporus biennis]|nr:hypothetical protein C8Q75DRAFT_895566 [Abortiporus biennis]
MSLVTILGQALSPPPSSIEILPGDISSWIQPETNSNEPPSPYLLVDGNLGIPQKVLYKAYMEAVKIFHNIQGSRGKQSDTLCPSRELIDLSSVILLANPAHHTAMNTRKRLVLSKVISVEYELRFTAVLLDIRDASKESTVWHHRRWLLRKLYHLPQPNSLTFNIPEPWNLTTDEDTLVGLDIPLNVMAQEFALAEKAAETYRRNYFAWSHRARCIDSLTAIYLSTFRTQPLSASSLAIAILEEFSWTLQWIESHIAEYTAMQYACRVHQLIHQSKLPSQLEIASYSDYLRPEKLVEHARLLVESYDEHEALWMYLRGAMESLEHVNASKVDLTQYKTFAMRYTQRSKITSRHASQFLSWLERKHETPEEGRADSLRRITPL